VFWARNAVTVRLSSASEAAGLAVAQPMSKVASTDVLMEVANIDGACQRPHPSAETAPS
jgi:hypothetical protein